MDNWNENISRCKEKLYNEMYILLRQFQSYCGSYRNLYRVLNFYFLPQENKSKIIFDICICTLL